MDRVADVLRDRPNVVDQSRCHCQSQAPQRAEDPHTVVDVPEQRRPSLQRALPTQERLRPAGQPGSVTAQSPVEPFDVRRGDPPAQSQRDDPAADGLQPSKLGTGPDAQQVPLGIADLVHDPDQQPRGRFQRGMFPPTATAPAPAMQHLAEDLKDRRGIRQMVVDDQDGGAGRAPYRTRRPMAPTARPSAAFAARAAGRSATD
jgi:hypothetical protein